MINRYIVITYFMVLAFAANAFPQLYPFRNYTPSKGLSQSTVNAIFQDDKGYLWFATGGGVSRFDGLDFEVYNSSNGLADDCVFCILQDSEGSFWFGTYRGISKYDGKNWSKYIFDQACTNCKVFAVLEDSKGNIWFGTDNGIGSLQDGQLKHYTVGDGLVDNYVNAIVEDKNGNMWFATKRGLSKFAGDKWTIYRIEDGLPDNGVNSIVEDRKGYLWIGTVNGVGKFDGENWQIVEAEGNLSHRDVKKVYEDSKGNLWFGMRGGGVVKFDGAGWKTFTAANGLVHNRITAIFEDRERNMWFGTERGGVSQLTGEAFCHYRVYEDKYDLGLSGNMITSLIEDSQQRLWVGTCMGGVSIFDGREWSTYSTEDGLISNCVTSILEQSNGDFWFGTERGGICRFDGKRWFVVVDQNMDFEEDRINKIIEDNQGNLWFASKRGALKYDGTSWTTYAVEDGLAGSVVNDIIQTTNGILWFATENGVSRFDGTKWDAFNKENELVGNQVYHMFEDSGRHLWFATSEGISKFDGASFQNLTVEDGLSSKFCYFIIGYKDFLFIGTSKGINRYDGQSYRVYSVQEGLSSNEMTMGACLKDSRNKLWFGTTSGLTRFDPELDRENITPPPVYITSVTVGDTNLAVNQTAVLSHDRNNIRFDFVSLCFTAPEKLVYSYKLDGWDTAWEETNQRSMRYTHLPSGEYTFRVKARNNAGIWSEVPAEYHFTLTPPLWETTGFKASSLILLVGLVFVAIRKRYKSRITEEVDKKNSELEKMMKELRLHQNEKDKSNELRTREERAFESLAENATDLIVRFDRQLSCVYVNSIIEKLTGLSRDDFIGKTNQAVLQEVLPPEMAKSVKEVFATGKSKTAEIKYVSRKLGERNFEASFIPQFGAKAQIEYVMAICKDLTELKLGKEKQAATEEFSRVLAENVAAGIAVIQLDKLVFVNKQFASMLGHYRENLLQKDFMVLVRDDFRADFAKLMSPAQPNDVKSSIKVVFQGDTDKEIWSEVHISKIEWQGDKADLITVQDISRQIIKELAAGEPVEDESEQRMPGADKHPSSVFGEIVGKSAPMQAVYTLIEKASKSDANVIVYGETGTGKELVAKTIHNMSQRANKPFVVVNCGAIPSSLFESEFFGYRKGAFTGAYEDKRGFFDIADGGTLLLDEVGELDSSMQVKLLRAVEGEGYSPVGGGDLRKNDVRIIGATNRDLSTGVKNGQMRSDFFYRMHIVPINLPPLRERREDILLLVKYFVSKHSGKSISDIPEEILEKLYNYDWPGNVRQLQNVILRYLTVGQFDLMEEMIENNIKSSIHRTYRPGTLNLKKGTENFEKQVILEALNLTQWHKSKAASIMGITRRTLFRKMKDYGLTQDILRN
ncbi:MAG: two-component regulator propeller domain-containing protein [Candidatus Glassbacteria bacterium]